MRKHSILVALALCATLGLAGCGEDNCGCDNDDNGGPGPTGTVSRTSTPAPQSPTPVTSPTGGGSPTTSPTGGGTPAPSPTGQGGDGCGLGAAQTITVESLAGSDLDTGWTGIAHNQAAIEQASVTTNLNCSGPNCTVDGANLVGTTFGPPLPLSSGGVPVCVINTFREAVTGTYNCETGCGESSVPLTSQVFLVQDIAKPCPLCNGDDGVNDGAKNGTCDSASTTPGAACDVNGVSPNFGPTSKDCLPTGSSVGELQINLSPLTTGTATVNADVNCAAAGFPPGSCYADGQIRPNACNSGTCPASGVCDSGPIDGVCSNARFRSCRSGTGTEDCDALFPGSGSCEDVPRPCFTGSISRTGQCGGSGNPSTGTLVAIFDIPATRAPAINTTAGLPGPGALTLPSRATRATRQ